jgi:hypothetical protein
MEAKMDEPDDHNEYDNDGCWNCGGEGRVNDCIDGCCVDQDDIYCPYCSKRCDVCNPKKKPTADDGADIQIAGAK